MKAAAILTIFVAGAIFAPHLVAASPARQRNTPADKAAVESARLNLEFTKITSPVDGIAGLAQAQIGDLVGPGGAALTTVSTVDPIRVYFNINDKPEIGACPAFEPAP